VELRRYVQHILAGDYDRAELEPPRFGYRDLHHLARCAIEKAGRPRPFADPRHYVAALGLRLLPRAPRGLCGEGSALDVVAFRWDPDPQVRGPRVMHGLAHAILRTETGASNDADAWTLTGQLFVLDTQIGLARARPDLACAHAPLWLVAARMIQANLAIPEAV
jgi:hypothetical protein